jgi:hypothetical protein
MQELESLTLAAKAFNAKTAEINEIITNANAYLAELQIGVETWLEWPASNWVRTTGNYTGRHQSESVGTFGTPIYDGDKKYDAIQVGYCKLGDVWEIALRTCQCEVTYDAIDTPAPVEVEGSRRSLIRATRADRISAIQLLQELYKAIEAHVRKMTEGIDRAKGAVPSP